MITEKQLSALRYLIFKALDGTDLTKRILAFLIEHSEGLTKDVCLTLIDGREGYSADEISAAANGLGAMHSVNCHTHLDQILIAMGVNIRFNHHYGDFDPNREGDPFSKDGLLMTHMNHPTRYTFWLSRESYTATAEYITATRELLEQINLEKPGLYPSLEKGTA